MKNYNFNFKVACYPLNIKEISDFNEIVALDDVCFKELSYGFARLKLLCEQAFILTAYANDQFAGGLIGRVIFSELNVTSFYINSLAVHPNVQHVNLGSTLLRKLEDELSKRGIYHLTLHCSKRVKTFYLKNGFEVTKKQPLTMEKIL